MTPAKKLTASNRTVPFDRSSDSHPTKVSDGSMGRPDPPKVRLVKLRHHPSVWLLPAGLLILAVLPWPYGYYTFLRLTVCAVSGWLAYTQWTHDNALSGWVVGLGAMSLLYNPVLPIHLTRDIWSFLNLFSAGFLLGHLYVLRKLVNEHSSTSSHDGNQQLTRM